MAEIHKKTYTEWFEKILNGEKTYDCRLADFHIEPGDIIVLDEIDNDRNYTGRSIRKKVGSVGFTKEMANWHKSEDVDRYGYQIISLLGEAK